jgi:hypothetical protein
MVTDYFLGQGRVKIDVVSHSHSLRASFSRGGQLLGGWLEFLEAPFSKMGKVRELGL